MRVLHLVDHLGLGGAQSGLLDYLDVADRDIHSTVLVLRDRHPPSVEQRLAAARVSLIRARLPGSLSTGFVGIWRAVGNADIVHTHLEVSSHFGTPLVRSMGRRRPRLIVQTDNDPCRYPWPHADLARITLPLADAHLVPGSSIRDAVHAFARRPLRRLSIVPLGIQAERFARQAADAREVADLRGSATAVIGAVCRLVPQKDLATLLRATRELFQGNPGLRLLLAGDGPQRPMLERLAAELQLRHVVRFLGSRHDLATVYAAMDVLALPSLYEGQGLVLVEAAAAGVPVVATSVSGIVDVVEPERSGLLVPPGDPSSLAHAIARILAHPALAASLVAAAHRRLDAYDRTRTARLYETLYRTLLTLA